jgi:hypothetical protein
MNGYSHEGLEFELLDFEHEIQFASNRSKRVVFNNFILLDLI